MSGVIGPQVHDAPDLAHGPFQRLGIDDLDTAANMWRPWKAYAVQYLWQSLTDESE